MSSNAEDKQRLIEGIHEYLQRNETYTFRPTKIDGTNVYIVIYKKYKIVTIESIFVKCKVKINSIEEIQNYSLFHFEYKTLKKAIDKIEIIKKEYKLYNGELVDSNIYKLSKLEESIVQYSEDEKCCVCFENTSDNTLCNHSICLTCRETSIINNYTDCPICRRSNALNYYNNKNSLINNDQFDVIKRAIHYENISLPSNRSYHIESMPNRGHYDYDLSETDIEQENNTEEDLEIEWIISRIPNMGFRRSDEIEDGEIIEDDRMDIDVYDEGSIMNPITIDDL